MPLAGTRVVDLTRILAGPYATMMLADYGADVVKIERPDGGDDTRAWGPPWVAGAGDASAYFTAVNRNKRSCALDLATEAGREVVWRLIDRADVLISNFRPGVMEGFGFGWEAVHRRNAGLVYAAINGYGSDVPWARKPAFDLIVQGEAGIMDITGDPRGAPARVGVSLGDLSAALIVVQGILAALVARGRSGEGQRVEVALHDALLSLLIYHAQGWWAGGDPPTRLGSAHPSIVPYQAFATADGWITAGVGNDGQWAAFCKALGRDEWIHDPRFATNADRLENRSSLIGLLEEIFGARSSAEWIQVLGAAEVPCGEVRSVPGALGSREARERGMTVDVPGIDGNPLTLLAPAVRLSGATAREPRRPPLLGEHTSEILTELGYTGEEIRALRRSGAAGGLR